MLAERWNLAQTGRAGLAVSHAEAMEKVSSVIGFGEVKAVIRVGGFKAIEKGSGSRSLRKNSLPNVVMKEVRRYGVLPLRMISSMYSKR